jgi:hypothetical protein
MKKYVLMTLMFFLGVVAYAQTATNHQWNETVHEFNKIPQGTPVSCEFKVTNKGATPLIIQNTTGSCGCTVPEWTSQPIAQGKTGSVKATFNAAASGPFNKTITVTFNNGTTEVLTIKGEVVAATSTPTPQSKQ